jgi:hypothetical protein
MEGVAIIHRRIPVHERTPARGQRDLRRPLKFYRHIYRIGEITTVASDTERVRTGA